MPSRPSPQFGKYLLEKQRSEWAQQYLDYKGLKDLIKNASEQAAVQHDPALSFSPRTTSLTVQRRAAQRDSAEEQFFRKLEAEVHKINKFTLAQTRSLEQRLTRLQERAAVADTAREKQGLLQVGGRGGWGGGGEGWGVRNEGLARTQGRPVEPPPPHRPGGPPPALSCRTPRRLATSSCRWRSTST